MFKGIGSAELDQLAEQNTEFIVNERGPTAMKATGGASIDWAGEHEYYLDDDYGRLWTRRFVLDQPAMLAGPLHPATAQWANHGSLQLPFKEAPRWQVEDGVELLQAIERFSDAGRRLYPGHTIVLRGQSQEYLIERSDKERVLLFGSAEVIEPSLRPSGSRRKGLSPRATALWSQLVQLHVASLGRYQSANDAPLTGEAWSFAKVAGGYATLALAQHYGMPTPALDVTTDPLTAIWFAMHAIRSSGGPRMEAIRPSEGEGVVYVLAVPDGQFCDDSQSPTALRPRRQRGGFVASNWGNSRNRSARYIVGAVYFPHAAFVLPDGVPATADLFPGPEEDWFLDLVQRLDGPSGNGAAAEIIEHLYWFERQVDDPLGIGRLRQEVPEDDMPLVLNEIGLRHVEAGRPRSGEDFFREAAILGDPAAAFNLGNRLVRRGLLAEAQIWFEQALDVGDADAATSLTYIFDRQGRIEEIEPILRSHADSNGGCAYNLAILLRQRDPIESRIWLERAAALGDVDAQRMRLRDPPATSPEVA